MKCELPLEQIADLFKQNCPQRASTFGPFALPDQANGCVEPAFLAVAWSGILDMAPNSYSML